MRETLFIVFTYRPLEEKNITAKDLTTIHVDGGKITEGGVRVNVSIALAYLSYWFQVRQRRPVKYMGVNKFEVSRGVISNILLYRSFLSILEV